jgi:hypothetical protein
MGGLILFEPIVVLLTREDLPSRSFVEISAALDPLPNGCDGREKRTHEMNNKNMTP